MWHAGELDGPCFSPGQDHAVVEDDPDGGTDKRRNIPGSGLLSDSAGSRPTTTNDSFRLNRAFSKIIPYCLLAFILKGWHYVGNTIGETSLPPQIALPRRAHAGVHRVRADRHSGMLL